MHLATVMKVLCLSLGLLAPLILPVNAQPTQPCPSETVELLKQLAETDAGAEGSYQVEACFIGEKVLAIQFSHRSNHPSMGLHLDQGIIALHDGRQALPFRANSPHSCIDLEQQRKFLSQKHEDGYHTCLASVEPMVETNWTARTLMEVHARRVLNDEIDPAFIDSLEPGLGAIWPSVLQSKKRSGVTVDDLLPCLHSARAALERNDQLAREMQSSGYGTENWSGDFTQNDVMLLGIIEAIGCVAGS